MKRTVVVVMAVAAPVFDSQAAQLSRNERTVIVHIANEHVAMKAAAFAKAQATKMFGNIGVRIQWHDVGRTPLPGNAIVVDIVEQAPLNECGGALACAKPYEGTHIRVFYDRLQTTVGEKMIPALLGHVMVHEITHMLQGTNHHTDRGVMKARWDANDFGQMRSHTLPFTDSDVTLINIGLAVREAASFPRALPTKVQSRQ
jgi:hypothetical protein